MLLSTYWTTWGISIEVNWVRKTLCDKDRFSNEMKLEIRCWVHFLVAFLRVIGKWRLGNTSESSFRTKWSWAFAKSNKFEAREMTLEMGLVDFVCSLPNSSSNS